MIRVDDEHRLFENLHTPHSSVAQRPAGKLGIATLEDYRAVMDPFQKSAQSLTQERLKSFLIHDSTSLGVWLVPFIDKNTLDLFSSQKPHLVKEAIKKIGPISGKMLEDARNGEGALYLADDNVRKAVPVIPDILKSLSHSYDFLQALRQGKTSGQLEALRALHGVRVPFQRVVDALAGELVVTNGNTDNISINGIQFGVFYNLLINARNYGQPLHAGSDNKSVVQYSSSTGEAYVLNYSNKPFPTDRNKIFEEGHFGLFIASLYAALLGKNLSFNSFDLKSKDSANKKYLLVASVTDQA